MAALDLILNIKTVQFWDRFSEYRGKLVSLGIKLWKNSIYGQNINLYFVYQGATFHTFQKKAFFHACNSMWKS